MSEIVLEKSREPLIVEPEPEALRREVKSDPRGRFLVLELPRAPEAPVAWARIADGRGLARGEDLVALPPPPADDEDERVVAIAPAEAVIVNYAALPGLSEPQARAAARLLASENSITALDALHVAVGEGEGDDRLIATVDRARMSEWLARLQSLGFDPDAIVPETLLLPRPEEGFVRVERGGQTLLRSRSSAFLDEDGLGALIVGDAPVTSLDARDAEAAMLAALADPPVDLRQGDFARRTRWAVDWATVRRLALYGLGIALALLLTNFVLIARYNASADALEARSRALAEPLTRGQGADPLVALDARLAAVRGGGAGFAASAAAIFSAVRTVPNIELTSFDFGPDGSLRLGIAAVSTADITAFARQLETYGFDGTATTPTVSAGRQVVEMTVKLP